MTEKPEEATSKKGLGTSAAFLAGFLAGAAFSAVLLIVDRMTARESRDVIVRGRDSEGRGYPGRIPPPVPPLGSAPAGPGPGHSPEFPQRPKT
jgi:hypothetical protein